MTVPIVPRLLRPVRMRDRLRRGLLLLKLRDEQLLRLFPGDGLVLSRAARSRELERRLNAIGMVERLHAGLPARARAAHADRMFGIALDLLRLHRLDALLLAVDRPDRLALHDANGDAASGRALLAERADPAFFAGHEPVFGDEQRNQLLRLAAPVEDEAGGARDAAGLEEISSFHLWQTRQSTLTCFSLWQSMHLPIVHLTFSRMSIMLAMSPWQVEHSTPAFTCRLCVKCTAASGWKP